MLKLRRFATVAYLTFLALPTLLVLGLIGYSVLVPTFEYRNVRAERDVVCPGEVLVVRLDAHLNIRRAVVFEVIENIWDTATGLPVVFDAQPVYSITTGDVVRDLVVRYTVPDLPPGVYEYRRAANSSTTRTVALAVQFTVPEGCS